MTFDDDLLVIGAGSGGVRAARTAAGLGARVTVVEDKALGGTCVNVGCVPKKLLWYGAHVNDDLEDAAGFGWHVPKATFSWETLRDHTLAEVRRLNGVYEKLFEVSGVQLVRGRGTLIDANTVEIVTSTGLLRRSAKHILIATGGAPVRPAIPGAEHAVVSDDLFTLPTWPKRVAVIGGGYIGVEFAGIFHGTGSTVHMIIRGEGVLNGFDHDVVNSLGEALKRRGLEPHYRTNVTAIEKHGAHKTVVIDGPAGVRRLDVDLVVLATGRAPLIAGLGLESVGVATDRKGAVMVDDHFATTVPGIYAIGDVVDRHNLTPVALAQGMLVARTLFGEPPTPLDWENIPTAVFSNPPVGTVGLSEAEARRRFADVVVYRSIFAPLKSKVSGREEKTMMKLVVDASNDRVIGVHMVGPDAGEIVQGFAVALKCGATKARFDATIGIHPTAAEEFVTMRSPHSGPPPSQLVGPPTSTSAASLKVER